MNFNESITLDTYLDKANEQFDAMQSRLSNIESNFRTRMNGKTTSDLIGAFIGTLCWFTAFIVCAFIVKDMVNDIFLAITLIAIIGLMAFMLIDDAMNFFYYRKNSGYESSIFNLQNRVSIGKDSIKPNHETFVESKKNGWNYSLRAGKSIPEESASIEITMSNMKSLKTGFINGVKNVLYYAVAIMITVTGSVPLFPIGKYIMSSISDESITDEVAMILNIIALVLVGIGEIILAKLVWSKTNCAVTNITLFITLLGPIAYLALITIATLLVALVVVVFTVGLYILGIIAVGAIVVGSFCGG